MVERFLQLEPYVKVLFLKIPKIEQYELVGRDWEFLKQFKNLFGPLVEVSQLWVGDEHPTYSFVNLCVQVLHSRPCIRRALSG